MKSSADSRLEFFGSYFFDQGTHVLTMNPSKAICSTCDNLSIPFSNNILGLPKILIEEWTTEKLTGKTIDKNGVLTSAIYFEKAGLYNIGPPKPFTDLVIEVAYPSTLNGKVGFISVQAKDDASIRFLAVKNISNGKASFQMPVNKDVLVGGSRDFIISLYVTNTATDLKVDSATGSFDGISGFSVNRYTISIPVADKEIKTFIDY